MDILSSDIPFNVFPDPDNVLSDTILFFGMHVFFCFFKKHLLILRRAHADLISSSRSVHVGRYFSLFLYILGYFVGLRYIFAFI